MTDWLFENPWPLCAIAGMTAVLLVAGAVKTGRARLLYASFAVLVLAGALFALERFVVTPGEEVAATLQQIAADLESNDVDGVLSHFSKSARSWRSEVHSILSRVVIQRATVKPNLRVELLGGEPPTGAKATFNGVIVASEKHGAIENQPGAWFFEVHFRHEEGQWRIWRYERHDPREGMR